MDPISVATLLGTCTALAGRVALTAVALHRLISTFKNADRDISRLGTQLNLFNATIEQLRQWLDRASVPSDNLRQTIHSALAACDDIVADIEEHVGKAQPKPGEEGLGLLNRVRYIWDERTVVEQERRLATQFQIIDFLIRVLQL